MLDLLRHIKSILLVMLDWGIRV